MGVVNGGLEEVLFRKVLPGSLGNLVLYIDQIGQVPQVVFLMDLNGTLF